MTSMDETESVKDVDVEEPESDVSDIEKLFSGSDTTSASESEGEKEREKLPSDDETLYEQEQQEQKEKEKSKKGKKKLQKGEVVKISEGIVISKQPFQYRKVGRKAVKEKPKAFRPLTHVSVNLGKGKGGLVSVPKLAGDTEKILKQRARDIVAGKFKLEELEAKRKTKAGTTVFEEEGEELIEEDIEFVEIQVTLKLPGGITTTENVIVPAKKPKKGKIKTTAQLKSRAEDIALGKLSADDIADLIDDLKFETKVRASKFAYKPKKIGRAHV